MTTGKSAVTAIDIKLATGAEEREEIIALRKDNYKHIYPLMDLDNDVLDGQGLILYTRGKNGQIDGTARLSVEGRHLLPEHDYLSDYYEQGRKVVEWGRFVIVRHEIQLLKAYYRSIYQLSRTLGAYAVIMAMKPHNIPFHQKLMGLRVIEPDTGETYGGPYRLACVAWEIDATHRKFFRWIQE